MGLERLSLDQIEQRVDSVHAATGMRYPPRGLQPYYEWLMQTLHLLAESSAGSFRVAKDDGGPTVAGVLPGRATIDGVTLVYDGGTVELGSFNNETAHIWLVDNGGGAEIGAGSASDGWPSEKHIKLAEVTLSGGEITSIVDRRFETMLKA